MTAAPGWCRWLPAYHAGMRAFLPTLLALVLAAPAPSAETPAPATDADAHALLTKVSAGAKDIATVRIPFTQEKHLAILEEPITSAGVIEISRTVGAVRWEFTGKSVMIFAHGKARRWGAEGKEESLPNDPSMKPFSDQMQAFLSGDWSELEKAFAITLDGEDAILMKPRSAQVAKYVASIHLRFRSDLTAPQEMRILAAGGDETIYRFSDPATGADLPAARFEHP
jgi:hypothetical protein